MLIRLPAKEHTQDHGPAPIFLLKFLALGVVQIALHLVQQGRLCFRGAVNETVSLIIGGVCSLVSIAFAVLTVIGIINAAKGTAKELPIIGNIKILK